MKYDFTRDSISVMLKDLSGNTFIGLTTETTPKLTGGMKNPQQGRVTKRVVSSVQIFTNQNVNAYRNKRNKNREAAGNDTPFELSPRAWGERIANTPFVTHKGNDYLEVIFNSVISTEFFLDGKSIEKDSIQGLPKSRPAAETDDVVIRTYKLESIQELRAFGEEFTA